MLVLILLAAANTSVQPLVEDYLKEYYKSSPMSASGVGYHKDGVDRRLDDVSGSARKKRAAYLHGMAKKLSALDRKALSPEDRADARLLDENIALELLSLEEAKDHARRPDTYYVG